MLEKTKTKPALSHHLLTAYRREAILRAALQGGAGDARKEADFSEDSSTRNLLDEMFNQF